VHVRQSTNDTDSVERLAARAIADVDGRGLTFATRDGDVERRVVDARVVFENDASAPLTFARLNDVLGLRESKITPEKLVEASRAAEARARRRFLRRLQRRVRRRGEDDGVALAVAVGDARERVGDRTGRRVDRRRLGEPVREVLRRRRRRRRPRDRERDDRRCEEDGEVAALRKLRVLSRGRRRLAARVFARVSRLETPRDAR
jgi:hypothetical protein